MTDEELRDLGRKISQMNETQRVKLDAAVKQASSGIKRKRSGGIIAGQTVGQDGRTSEQEESTRLDETGGISVENITTIRMHDCGHPSLGVQNFGGKCQIPGCERTFCNKFSGNNPLCYGRCVVCHRMLCMRHSKTFDKSKEIYCCLLCFFKKKLGLAR